MCYRVARAQMKTAAGFKVQDEASDGNASSAQVWSSSRCLFEQVGQRREGCQRDILAEVWPKRGIEGDRTAFAQGHDLYKPR